MSTTSTPEIPDHCRFCSHYSCGRMPGGPIAFAHLCSHAGRDKPRVIRWAVTGPAQPVYLPEWCPLLAERMEL